MHSLYANARLGVNTLLVDEITGIKPLPSPLCILVRLLLTLSTSLMRTKRVFREKDGNERKFGLVPYVTPFSLKKKPREKVNTINDMLTKFERE